MWQEVFREPLHHNAFRRPRRQTSERDGREITLARNLVKCGTKPTVLAGSFWALKFPFVIELHNSLVGVRPAGARYVG